MKRINLFAKGNVDVHDSLIYSRVNGRILWNGLNTLLAERHPSHLARIRHEPCARWDLLGTEGNPVPRELEERNLALGSFTLDTQYRSRLHEQRHDVVVLSIQSDVMNPIFRHSRDGYAFLPAGISAWTAEDDRWLHEDFSPLGLSTPGASMRRLASVLEDVRRSSDPSVLVFNMSSAIPGESIVSHRGLEDALSTRIRAFNLALIDVAPRLDISIIDVDHVIARAGADRCKVDALHYTPEGYRLIAGEVMRVLEDLGRFDS